MNRVPNLDRLNLTALHEFSVKHEDGRNYRDLFPEGGKFILHDTKCLSAYAHCKWGERTMVDQGDMPQALVFRGLAGNFYNKLTAPTRWKGRAASN